jgi:hypothetical protein
MSSLTRCNHCTLLDIKRRNPDKAVNLRAEDGWIQVYVDGVRYGASFLEVSDYCVC